MSVKCARIFKCRQQLAGSASASTAKNLTFTGQSLYIYRRSPGSLGTVPVHNFYPVARLLQVLGNIFRDHDRAVLAAGAAESNC